MTTESQPSIFDQPQGKPWEPTTELVELPGKDGQNNWYNQPMTLEQARAEAQKGLTDEEIDAQQALNLSGVALARETLRGQRQDR